MSAPVFDHLRLCLPISPIFVKELAGVHSLLRDPDYFGFDMSARAVKRDDDGNITVSELYHPYESLPSSFSSMAVKLYDHTRNHQPHVEIKASPVKLLQGHNVYGTSTIQNGAFEMLGLLFESMPKLAQFIDLANIEVRHLDVTYSSSVDHPSHVTKVIDYLSRISVGQTKPTADKKYRTTAYWGGEHSRLVQMKCYGKFAEISKQIDDLHKLSKQGCVRSQQLLTDVFTPKLQAFSQKLLRWEARVKARKLQRMGIPTNLLDLIVYEANNPDMQRDLWQQCFIPIFNALEGLTMLDDSKLTDFFNRKLVRTTPSGKTTYVDAKHAHNLYDLIKLHGFEEAKTRYSSTTFYRHLALLAKAGLSKAWLQNLHTEQVGKVIPLVRYCQVNFDQQAPSDYVAPVTKYNPLAA